MTIVVLPYSASSLGYFYCAQFAGFSAHLNHTDDTISFIIRLWPSKTERDSHPTRRNDVNNAWCLTLWCTSVRTKLINTPVVNYQTFKTLSVIIWLVVYTFNFITNQESLMPKCTMSYQWVQLSYLDLANAILWQLSFIEFRIQSSIQALWYGAMKLDL